jgi:hypothetical protein
LVRRAGRWLKESFDVVIYAFSFHEPKRNHLAYEKSFYGGLVNCYFSKFKNDVPYCSDSNGYWRFRRLHEVLESGSDNCLQVLTHPGWWQKESMPPRQRVVRCVYGRAEAVIKNYDSILAENGRESLS